MYSELQRIIDESPRILFFGGAGVSTESGIPEFGSVDGLYNQRYDYPPETILSATFFRRHTEEFYRFYRDKMLPLEAKPNPAHFFLAELEQTGKLTAVITQNIDGLHQAAGSKTVLELHGSIHRNRCLKCAKFFPPEYIRDSKRRWPEWSASLTVLNPLQIIQHCMTECIPSIGTSPTIQTLC